MSKHVNLQCTCCRFCRGALASFIGILAHYVNFMDFSPKFILTSWSNMTWIDHWLGTVMTMIIFGILSVGIAFIYYSLFKRMKSIFPGIILGWSAGLCLYLS
ncbi:hypothetical protein GTW56_15030 [Bacillus sp. EB93]|nr:hypothetical protein [Peribacillus frigoritolerans]